MKNLNKLIIKNDGYVFTGTRYANYQIYKKGDKRIMYNPADDNIVLRYSLNPEIINKSGEIDIDELLNNVGALG